MGGAWLVLAGLVVLRAAAMGGTETLEDGSTWLLLALVTVIALVVVEVQHRWARRRPAPPPPRWKLFLVREDHPFAGGGGHGAGDRVREVSTLVMGEPARARPDPSRRNGTLR